MNKKTIDSEIAKYQKKIDELKAEKEKITRKLIDSCIENIPSSIENIVGHLCIRYQIPWLLSYNYLNSTFCVIGFNNHEDTIIFNDSGKFKNHGGFLDHSYPLGENEDESDYISYFAVKFSPIDGDFYQTSSVKIDVNTGKIVE